MGINTHWNYSEYGAPGTTRYTQVKAKLQELGLRHARDNALQPSINASLDLWNTIGVKTTFICGRKSGGSLVSSQIDAELDSLEPVAAAIAALEGPNEYDEQSPDSETNWASKLVDYQKILFTQSNNSTLHAPLNALPVIAPSVTSPTAANAVYAANGNANLGPWIDYNCLHMYQSSRWPGTPGWGANGYGSIDWGINLIGAPLGGSKTIQSTEGGYNTGRTSEDRYVIPDVEARYLPRMFAEFFRRGFFRSFKYELVDAAGDNGFGLMDASLNIRPAFTSVKNLVTAMKDPSPLTNFTPTALDFTLSGVGSDTRQLFFQKSDGSYYLMLWRETSSMNPDTKAPITVPTDTVTLALPASITSVSTNLPKNNATFSSVAISSGQVTLEVPDHILIVRLGGSATIRYEAENLTELALSSGDTVTDFTETGLSNNAATLLNANASGDFVTYRVNVPQARTYKIFVGVKKKNNRGIFQMATAASLTSNYNNRGSAQDTYNSTSTTNRLEITTMTFDSAGDKAFRFLCTGKNGSSSGFGLCFDYIELVPQ